MSDALDDDKPTRRDFLYITTGAFGGWRCFCCMAFN